jgi:hypothetical protein
VSGWRACPGCGRLYVSALPTHLLCRVCYFERHGDYEMALAEESWRRGFGFGYQRGHVDALEARQPILPAPLLDAAIALCHPDRHPEERSRQANALTADLLAARERIKRVS